MNSELLSFAAGLAALIAYGAVFLIFVRLFSSSHWFSLQVLLGALVHLVFTALFFIYLPEFYYWHSLGIFSVGWFLFFTFSTAIYVSISARILRQLSSSPNQTMGTVEIFEKCISPPFELRANFLVKNGLAELRDGKYSITPKGRLSAEGISSMRRFFNMDMGGLYTPKKPSS